MFTPVSTQFVALRSISSAFFTSHPSPEMVRKRVWCIPQPTTSSCNCGCKTSCPIKGGMCTGCVRNATHLTSAFPMWQRMAQQYVFVSRGYFLSTGKHSRLHFLHFLSTGYGMGMENIYSGVDLLFLSTGEQTNNVQYTTKFRADFHKKKLQYLL